MRKPNIIVLTALLAVLALSPVAVTEAFGQDTDGAEENARDDGFDWGWLGLLGLLGLLPRKPIDEHENVRVGSDRSRAATH